MGGVFSVIVKTNERLKPNFILLLLHWLETSTKCVFWSFMLTVFSRAPILHFFLEKKVKNKKIIFYSFDLKVKLN